MQQPLETQRLILRRFTAEDGPALYEYLSDPAVVEYEPYPPFSAEQAQREARRRGEDPSFWAVCLKEGGGLIGNVYFCRQEPEEWSTWEIGYVFNRRYGGRGYATEAAARMLRYGFEECAAHRIEAHCNPENAPSWRLLERLGLRREGFFLKKVFFHRDSGGNPLWHDVYSYGMLAEEWRDSGRA